ncbi:MAG: transaldolase family protein [Rubripirellula sp.]|nr:transaldolase family protein [Rubripirellula sp.]
MADSIRSLIATGTKLYLDSVEPSEVDQNLAWGAVGATSNPAIISGIVKAGGLDAQIESLLSAGHDDESVAWALTDSLVTDAQQKFQSIHSASDGNAGWVSFELDPLLEDPSLGMSDADRTAKYIELGKKWSKGHTNRMIKVPASEAGLAALEELAASGVTLNVTLIFTDDQYTRARDAVWRGGQRRDNTNAFKSVYSIFVSRIDVYTQQVIPGLSADAQGQVGILNAKRIWAANQQFWSDRGLRLEQELIFASTGTKNPGDAAWKYVEALAGSDIQTNPPETNVAVSASGIDFTRKLDELPPQGVQQEIDAAVDTTAMHCVLMQEGIDKFVKPQRALLELIASKRKELSPGA